jgi:hypothetical protein
MQVRATHLRKFGLVLATFVLAAVLSVFLRATTTAEVARVRAADPAPHEWVIATGVTATVSIIDTTTDIVYGPFLSGTLGSQGGHLLDVAVTPDGQTALMSNFGDSAVYFVDVSNPINPSVITSVTTPMFAEDIAISHDGRFALVTDGVFSPWIAVLDLDSITLAYSVTLGMGSAHAVDIAPDGTVVVVDYYGSWVQTLYPDASGHLTVTGAYSYGLTTDGQISFTGSLDYAQLAKAAHDSPRAASEPSTPGVERPELATAETRYPHPINVAIAPDGQTVLICDVSPYTETIPPYPGETFYKYAVGVYRITAPGELTFTDVVTGLPRATQSIAFSPDGTKAYLSGNGAAPDDGSGHYHYNHMTVLDIDGPGMVSVNRINAVDYPRLTSSQLFGVDSIAVSNGKAYVAYPNYLGESNDLRVVNLSDYSVKRLDMPGICNGVAVIPIQRVYLPVVLANFP